MLTLKVLEKDCVLNNFTQKSSASFVSGEDVTIRMQLWQADRSLRYIPAVGATLTFSIKKSDDTALTKTATFPFPEDRSVVQITLTAVESALVISQNLVGTLAEGSATTLAILNSGFQKISTSGC